MGRKIEITLNEYFPAAVCVQVNFLHDINGMGAIRLLGECSKAFSGTVTLVQAGSKQPQNDMVYSAFYTVTPRNPSDVTRLAQALIENLPKNQHVRQTWTGELDVQMKN